MLDMIVNKANKTFDLVAPYQNDPFVGHLSTPISTSNLTKTYLASLPAYKPGLSPLLRGINIGYVHGYFLLGPFIDFGPLRNSQVAGYVGFISTISLIIILTTCLLIYGFASFPEKSKTVLKKSSIDFLNSKGWSQFTSGFIVGGFGGTSIAYLLLKTVNFDIG